MNPDDYCQQKAAVQGSSLYYSLLFLPEPRRQAITAVQAFAREVGEIVDEVSEPGVARMKLAWWRTQIERLYAGQPDHPVGRALAPAVERFDLPRERFDEVIAGVTMDVDHAGYANIAELVDYCYYTAATVALLSADILGYSRAATLDHARDLGIALQLTRILREVRGDASRGRIYLPVDRMDVHGVGPDDLLRAETPDRVRTLLAEHAGTAREYYNRALATLPDADRPAQRSALITAQIRRTLLDEIERDGFRVLEHRITLTPLRKLWIAWRCHWRERDRGRWLPSTHQ